MRLVNTIILFFLVLFLSNDTFAQNYPEKTDSAKFYRDIETFSKKRKSTKFLYRLLFKPVDVPVEKKTTSKKKKEKKVVPPKPYSYFEGKIIREIYITTLDP